MFTVSCGTLETDQNVFYSNYTTLEGSTVTFWCTGGQMSAETFTSKCSRNGSWVPNPISQCTALHDQSSTYYPTPQCHDLMSVNGDLAFLSIIQWISWCSYCNLYSLTWYHVFWIVAIDGGERSDQSVAIAGGFLGVLAVILLMLLALMGIVILVKRGAQNRHNFRYNSIV